LNTKPADSLGTLRRILRRAEPHTRLGALVRDHLLVEVGGAAGSLRALCLADLLETRPGLVLVEDQGEADELADDLVLLLGQDRVFPLPQTELAPYDEKTLPLEKRSAQVEIYRRLRLGDPLILVAGMRQLLQRHPDPRELDGGLHVLEPGMSLDRDGLIRALEAADFERVPVVEDIAQYSVRGGILDLYPWGQEYPIRLEFYGDEIESVRAFDPGSQTSTETLASVTLALHAEARPEDGFDIFHLLRQDALVAGPPLDILRSAGVDLETPAPIVAAMDMFERTVDEFDRLWTKKYGKK